MQITVLYFAGIRDLVGTPHEVIELPPNARQLDDLLERLLIRHPVLKNRMQGVRIAQNEEFVSPRSNLADQDVIALIPPVAGG